VSYYKAGWLLGIALMMQGCTQLDDYLLGKDNTPLPTPLPAVEHQVPWTEQWSLPLGRTHAKLKPVVQGDTIYIADVSGRLMAVNKVSGQMRWSQQLPKRLVGGPVVHNGIIALATHDAGIMVLDERTQRVLWQARVSSDVLSSPLMTHQLLIAKTVDGHLIAFDLKNGKKRWEVDHGSPHLILKASSSPILTQGRLLVGFSDGKLDAIDPDSGRVIWQKSIAYATGASDVERLVDIDADPISANGVVYIASYQGYLSAININNGELLWSKPASTYKNLAFDTHSLYMTDEDDVIRAFNPVNGQVRWKQTDLTARHVTAPVNVGTWIIVGDETGWLHLLDSRHGDLRGRVAVPGAVEMAPVVSEQRVYVITQAGSLTCFTLGG
jgi:outer membrane protein assembly factor BamB